MAQKILIDTDPGVDDTMAILFALRSPELEVVGLTTVFGNGAIEVTTRNALRLVELEGHGSIPVARGAGVPLVRPLGRLGSFVHGEDGMGNSNPPPPAGQPVAASAAQFIVDTVRAHPGEITLVPVGPLTNIAMALRLAPDIVGLVKEVVIMGGSAYARGNASPAAEANIHNDPEAAQIVFSAGSPLTMVGLDVTKACVMSADYLTELCQPGCNPAVDLIGRVLPFYQEYHQQAEGLNGAIHTHDPSAVAYVVDPSLFQTRSMPVYVETLGNSAGDTVPDPHGMVVKGPPVNVCLQVDSDRLLDLYRRRLRAETLSS